MKKLSIGVIMGTKSIEREVSFNSGRTICDYLDTARYSVVPIFITMHGELFILPWRFLHRGKISDFEQRLSQEAQRISWDTLRTYVDFVYPAVHGRWGEDGTLQGMLEILGIPYFGSKIFASALGMDKYIQKAFLESAGIAVPRSIRILSQNIFTSSIATLEQQLAQHQIALPCIVKPRAEGSSFGVTRVETWEQLRDAIIAAATITGDVMQDVLIEEYIEGMEFSCIVIEENGTFVPLEPTEIVRNDNRIFDYDQKYMPGVALKYTPARCSTMLRKKIGETCVAVMRALEFQSLGRIDGIVRADGIIVIIDPNSFCGLSPASFAFFQAAESGMSHTTFVNYLIDTELRAYGMIPPHTTETHNTLETRLRVGVMLGGHSNEREISLESGRNIIYKLSPHRYVVTPLFLSSHNTLFEIPHRLLVKNTTTVIEESLAQATPILWSDLSRRFDFIFLGLHGGEGENGTIQGVLETLGIPYNGSGILTSALCMNKWKTNQYLRARGIDVPRSILVSCTDDAALEQFLAHEKFPLIVKPHDDGCSVLVHKVFSRDELHAACEKLFAAGKTHALIEECVQGMELTVGIIGNENPRALPPTYAVAQAGILSIKEKFLPGAGENQTPAPLSEEACTFVQRVIEQTFKELGCTGYARIDCFYQSATENIAGKERVVILEVNTLPGLTPATCLFHQAAEVGMQPMDLLDTIVQLGLTKHRKNNHNAIASSQEQPTPP